MRSARVVALLSLFTSVLTACPAPEPAVLELNKQALDFGTVEVNAGPFRLPLVLSNPGAKPLHFKTLRLDSPTEELTLEANFDGLDPMDRRVAAIVYQPTRDGTVNAELRLDPQDGQGERVVTITGRAGTRAAVLRPEQGVACELDFGTISAGTDVSRRVTVESTGTVAITVFKAESSLLAAGFRVEGPFGQPIEPGTSADFQVHLDPTQAGALASQLTFITNSARGPRLTVTACADARVPLLCVTPAELDLGAVSVGGTANATLRAQSCGNLPVSVTGLELAAPTAGGYTLSMSPTPRLLQPGEELNVALTFAATSELVARGKVRFTTDSVVTPEVIVNVGANLPPPCSVKLSPSTLSLYAAAPLGTVRITNQGSNDCFIQRVEVVPATAAFSIERALVPPLRLAARASMEFPLRFSPATTRSESAKLEIELDFVRSVTLRGSSSAPPGCRLQPSAPNVNFGVLNPGVQRQVTVGLTNLGSTSCTIASMSATDPDISLSVGTTQLNPRESAVLTVDFRPRSGRSTKPAGQIIVASNDPYEPELALDVVGGSIYCDPNCMCGDDQVLAYWRYGSQYSGSGITPAPDNGAIQHSCEPNTCTEGQVLAEVGRGALECVPTPMNCDGEGTNLEWTGMAWRCVPCDVVVQYGGLYDGERVCAPRPNVTCTGNTTPTFDVDHRRWECQPTCNNTQYDQVQLDGQLICVPC